MLGGRFLFLLRKLGDFIWELLFTSKHSW